MNTSAKMDPSPTLAGTCLCGSVRYAVKDEFLYALNCHCSNCRRATGAAFKPFAGIERAKLSIVEGGEQLAPLRRREGARRPLRKVRLAPVLGRARGRLRSRHDGNARRRSKDPPDRAHLSGLQGTVVHDYR